MFIFLIIQKNVKFQNTWINSPLSNPCKNAFFSNFSAENRLLTYNSFCEVMGPETITLKEFEIWYNRFSRGEFDLDYDIGSNTSDLELSNLPNDAIEKIIESCDLKEQLTLRKVSRSLRSLVDKHKVAFKSIEIYPRHSCIFCAYNGKKVVYASENWDEKEEEGKSHYQKRRL
ncbi:hypothetical protein CRE_15741 [Caenorhabditis remanei]|uniref:F-box domain-containing protein n=1 Tax=Caenorhabditis remanei TaxID=31234 RepID=E3NFC8_CAERE|nr:hypothetical protein CRE_15741 [Caenorhabditis remanei]